MPVEEATQATPVPRAGSYLNLPVEPVGIKCPSCGVNELTEVEEEPIFFSSTFNRIRGCLYFTFCCCFCFDCNFMFQKSAFNHYCKSCRYFYGAAVTVDSKTPTNGTQ